MKFCPQCTAPLNKQTNDGRLRFVCSSEACHYIHWINPTPVVAAIIEYDSQILLVHNVGWPPKMLGLVSGFLEAREHPDEGIVREILEETNLHTDKLSFLGHYPFAEQNQIILAYHALCSGHIQLNEELDRYKLLDRNALKPWLLGTGPAVRDWLAMQGICTD